MSRWSTVASAAGAKVVVMGVTGLIGLVTSRLILQHYGVEAYAQYGLLASLPALLPFADLGIAAVVINAAAESSDPRRDERLRRTLTSAIRVLVASGSVIALVALVLSLLDLWPAILGAGLLAGGGWVAGICMMLFGLVLPLTIGARLLIGLGRNTTQIATQVLTAPIILACIGGCVFFGVAAGDQLAIFTYVASAVVATVSLSIAARLIAPQLRLAVHDVPRMRQVRGVPVLHLAVPMLVQMLALPIAMQSARILISHLQGAEQLAQYNLASQIFGIALQTIAAAGVALWPIYARARAASSIDSPFMPVLWFLLGGTVLGGAMALASPLLVEITSAGKLQLDGLLVGSFVVFITAQAAKYPVGMYMTDVRGLRFQMLPTIVMIPIAIGLSLALIPSLGAAGSVLAVTIAVVVCQVIPNLLYVRADLRKRTRELALEAS